MKTLSLITKLIISAAICIDALWVDAQPPAYIWAKTLPGNVETIQRNILTDALGNVYISGVFFGTVDFDPGAGVANITPSPYGSNVYIAKYDAGGNYQWAKNIPIAASYGGSSMDLDGSGNLYITGFFSGTNLDFDPGAGSCLLSSAGGNDMYMAKYDNNGNYLWAKNIGSSGDDRGNEILVTASGDLYVTGCFSMTVDFDPGAGTANLTAAGGFDSYLARYTSGGAFLWVKQIGGLLTEDVRDIAIDNTGAVFLTGLFAGTTDFDPGPGTSNLTSAGGNDIFIAGYDASGDYLWANRFGGTNADGGSALQIDAAGNIVVSGIFMGTVDFDPGAGVANLTIASGATFYGKYDPNGNYIWIKQLPINFYNSDIALDPLGNIFVSGYYGNGYGSPIDMDPGAGVANLAVPSNLPPPTYNILGYYDAMGNYKWAGVFGRQCYCSVMGYKSSLAIDPAGFFYYAGIFNGPWGTGTVDFDPGSGIANLIAPSSVDNAFFAKYGIPGNPLPVELIDFNGENKNEFNHLIWTTASEINNDYFDVERSADGIAFNKIGRVTGNGTTSMQQHYYFDDADPLKNINYYRLLQVDYNGDNKISEVIAVRAEQSHQFNLWNANGTIHILNPAKESATLIIRDISGRIIKKQSFSDEEFRCSIELFPSGIYFVQVTNEKGGVLKELISK